MVNPLDGNPTVVGVCMLLASPIQDSGWCNAIGDGRVSFVFSPMAFKDTTTHAI